MDALDLVNRIYRNRGRIAVISAGLLIILFGLLSIHPEPHNGMDPPPPMHQSP
jgi:hypothetical protein